jgi:hypothetical protein
MIIETVLSVLTVVEKGQKVYDWFSGASFGNSARQRMNSVQHSNSIIKLSDRVFVSPDIVQAINLDGQRKMNELREMREILDPMAACLDSEIYSTQIGATPLKLKDAFAKDPWAVLMNVRPADRARPSPDTDHVPILFSDDGRPYIGWQMRGALPILFGCEFEDSKTSVEVPTIPQNSYRKWGKNTVFLSKTFERSVELSRRIDIIQIHQNSIKKDVIERDIRAIFSDSDNIAFVVSIDRIFKYKIYIAFGFDNIFVKTTIDFKRIPYDDLKNLIIDYGKIYPNFVRMNGEIFSGFVYDYFGIFLKDIQNLAIDLVELSGTSGGVKSVELR